MIDFNITFQADKLLYRDYGKMILISKSCASDFPFLPVVNNLDVICQVFLGTQGFSKRSRFRVGSFHLADSSLNIFLMYYCMLHTNQEVVMKESAWERHLRGCPFLFFFSAIY